MPTISLIRMFALSLYISQLMVTGLLAQSTNRIVVKAGEDFMTSIYKKIYHYPQFKDGMVRYKDGTASGGSLNYNLLIGEMQFIDPNGDTMSIANEKTLDYITISEDSFFYDHGYLALIASNKSVKLAMKERIKLVDKKKIGAYDQASSTGSIDSYSSVQGVQRSFKLEVKEDIVMAKETTYYVGDRFNHFVYANKRNIVNHYAKNQNQLEKYLRENTIDFKDTKDLIKLIDFLQHF